VTLGDEHTRGDAGQVFTQKCRQREARINITAMVTNPGFGEWEVVHGLAGKCKPEQVRLL